MLILLSPAKTQNFEDNYELPQGIEVALPFFPKHIQALVDELKAYTPDQIQKLMSVSENIANLNFERYANFSDKYTSTNSKPALLTFSGDVYRDIEADSYSAKDWQFAENHLAIISGLYGILSPLTLMQAYRLEMKTKLPVSKNKDLYQFWSDQLINKIKYHYNPDFILNLASKEYSKAILVKSNDIPVLNITFKENKGGQYKIVAIYAKKARGTMANYVIKNKITSKKDLQKFNLDGYRFSAEDSSENEYIFLRG